jgi:thioredoxin-like negative regulator of GroEL
MKISVKERKSIIAKAREASGTSLVSECIDQLNTILSDTPLDIELLHTRAQLYEKQQEWANAINDYLKILSLDQNDNKAKTQSAMLKTILRYNNTDIYSSPNTHYDPWFE